MKALTADAGALAVVEGLEAAARRAAPAFTEGVPSHVAAAARLAGGVPALTGEALITPAELAAQLESLATVLEPTAAGPAARAAWVAIGGLDPDALELVAAAALAGRWDALTPLATRLRTDEAALVTLLDQAVRPALQAAAARIGAEIARAGWSRGTCPACGAPAALSGLRGKEQERRLYCARCGTGWPHPRVQCPTCGERAHERLGLLHGAGEGEFRRAEVCDGCGTYIKSVALLDEPNAERLLRIDLETAALDFLAIERGYRRPTPV